jgi:hypothetical protein
VNTLELRTSHVEGWVEPVVEVFVDGQNLIQLAHDVELPFAEEEDHPDIAGSYTGLSLREAIQALEPPPPGAARRVSLLACGDCGEEGCWPLAMTISADREVVTWSAFAQPHRKTWDLSALGPFTFDAAHYESSISVLAQRSGSGLPVA